MSKFTSTAFSAASATANRVGFAPADGNDTVRVIEYDMTSDHASTGVCAFYENAKPGAIITTAAAIGTALTFASNAVLVAAGGTNNGRIVIKHRTGTVECRKAHASAVSGAVLTITANTAEALVVGDLVYFCDTQVGRKVVGNATVTATGNNMLISTTTQGRALVAELAGNSTCRIDSMTAEIGG